MTTEITKTQKPTLNTLNDSMLRMESTMATIANAIVALNDRVSALESSTPEGKAKKVAPSKVQPKKSSTAAPTEKPYTTVHPYSEGFPKVKRSWGTMWCYYGTIGFTVGKPNPDRKRVVPDDPFAVATSEFKKEVSTLSKREWKYGKGANWQEGLKSLFEELEAIASLASDGECASFKVAFRKYAEDDFRVGVYRSFSDKDKKAAKAPF